MSEEEKNALKCLEWDMLDSKQIEIVLNLIDKQQKEIVLLKYNIANLKARQEDMIHTDKIKEIIKKYAEEDVITYKELTDLVAELNDLAY